MMAIDRSLASLTIAELVEGLTNSSAGGGSELVEEIIRRFRPLLRRAWQHGGFQVDYQDFVQEVFAELFSGFHLLREPRAFPGYFRSVALSVAARLARSALRNSAPREVLVSAFASWGDELFARVAVRSALEQLPSRERAVIELLLLEEQTVADVAYQLGIQEGAVRMTKSRAIRRLRDIFEADAVKLESDLKLT